MTAKQQRQDNDRPDLLMPLQRLSAQLKKAAATLRPDELRYLVDLYYQKQNDRLRGSNQIRSMPHEPNDITIWALDWSKTFEQQILRALNAYTDSELLGRWCKSIVGIGPVITAGLMAHIDIEKAPTVGHIWGFAGLNPDVQWKKGERRPWNARLKTLAWKAGESFVKFQNHEHDVYGKLFVARKEYEINRNERGELSDQAKAKLKRTNIGEDTKARGIYESGKLPPAHIHARAVRWTTKLFLAHYQHVAYEIRYEELSSRRWPGKQASPSSNSRTTSTTSTESSSLPAKSTRSIEMNVAN